MKMNPKTFFYLRLGLFVWLLTANYAVIAIYVFGDPPEIKLLLKGLVWTIYCIVPPAIILRDKQ